MYSALLLKSAHDPSVEAMQRKPSEAANLQRLQINHYTRWTNNGKGNDIAEMAS